MVAVTTVTSIAACGLVVYPVGYVASAAGMAAFRWRLVERTPATGAVVGTARH
eukprot:gene55167-26966_t